jgi:porin
MMRVSTHAVLVLVLCCGASGALATEPRNDERERAWHLSATYSADLLRNLSGGLAVGSAYLDNLELKAAVDAGAQWGWNGWSFMVSALYNNRARFSERYSGDAQTASNIDAPRC